MIDRRPMCKSHALEFVHGLPAHRTMLGGAAPMPNTLSERLLLGSLNDNSWFTEGSLSF